MGFDAYRKVIASELDVVLLCTPPGHRPAQFEAAVNGGKHIFTEKPIATDAVGTRRFLASVQKARDMKLTVVAGTNHRSQKEFIETVAKNSRRRHRRRDGPERQLPQRAGTAR